MCLRSRPRDRPPLNILLLHTRFSDERTPIEATPLSATSVELWSGLGLGLGLGSLAYFSTHALPFLSPPSFQTRSLSPAFTSVWWSATFNGNVTAGFCLPPVYLFQVPKLATAPIQPKSPLFSEPAPFATKTYKDISARFYLAHGKICEMRDFPTPIGSSPCKP